MKNSINFDQIKNQIIAEGRAHKEAAEKARETVIYVSGIWNRKGTADITKIHAGWVINDIITALPVDIEIPVTTDDEELKSQLQSDFPDAYIVVKII